MSFYVQCSVCVGGCLDSVEWNGGMEYWNGIVERCNGQSKQALARITLHGHIHRVTLAMLGVCKT